MTRKRSGTNRKTNKKLKKRDILIGIFLLIIIIAISIVGIYANESAKEDNGNNGNDIVGENFEFTLVDGTIKHLSDYRGKIVILDMWATWCGPCKTQLIELNKINEHYGKEDLEIISLNIDYRETSQYIIEFIEDFKNDYDIELDWTIGQDDGSVWEEYMINGGIPTLYIFDQKGNIHFTHEGVSFFSEIPYGYPDTTPILPPIIDELL